MKVLKRVIGIIAIVVILVLLGMFMKYKEAQKIQASYDVAFATLTSLGKLETATLNMNKQIVLEKATDAFGQNTLTRPIINKFLDKRVLDFQATVVAGFDMSKVAAADVVVNKDLSVTVTLPQPEFLNIAVNKTGDSFSGKVLSTGDIEAEAKALADATKFFETEAKAKSIFDIAQVNAEKELQEVLAQQNMLLKGVIIK